MSGDTLRELTASLEELARRRRTNQLEYFQPYEKQKQFFKLGATKRERALLAGNQCGKSTAASFELAMHTTGLYPSWWEGKRFNGPVRTWACGQTAESLRDTMQRLLLGPLNARGTGAIPEKLIREMRTGRG